MLPHTDGDSTMTESDNNAPKRRSLLPARRLTLLASVAGVGIAVVLGGPYAYHHLSLSNLAQPVHAQPTHAHPARAAESPPAPQGFADLVAKVKPAVASVRVRMDESVASAETEQNSSRDQFLRRFGAPETPPAHQVVTGLGSGFFVSADGYAVTNYHVVDHATSVQVTTDDGKTHTAKVVGTDQETDLALIKVDGSDFPFVTFADHEPRDGDWVVAIGNPFGLGGTVTAGIVSAHGRDIGSGPYDDFIQIDAPINKGNSGGPTFDLSGKVVGVNTAIYSPSEGSVGVGFDIPATTAKAVIAQLKEKGHVTRGWIGVQVQPVTEGIAEALGLKEPKGALVDEAQSAGPAAKAGLKAGDVVTAVDGVAIKSGRDLAQQVGAKAPGTSMTLNVVRNGDTKSLTVTLGTMPDEKHAQSETAGPEVPAKRAPQLGLSLAAARDVAGAGSQGVAVIAVDPSGPGADSGLQAGDVILEVAGKTVLNPSDVLKELAELKRQGKRAVLMRVKSGEATKFVALPLDQA
jgi:serine protease Do